MAGNELIRISWASTYFLCSVLRIYGILVWIRIRIRGSMPLTNGSWSGSGSCIRILLFSSLTFKMPTRNKFKKKLFSLLATVFKVLYIFKDKKVKKSHNTVGIKIFLTIFVMMIEGSGSIPLIRIRIQEAQKHTDPTDPDPQSGSATLCAKEKLWIIKMLFLNSVT